MAPKKSSSVLALAPGEPLSTAKLSLPAFLKMLTTFGMTMADAMAAAKNVFPTHSSPAQLAELTPVKLIELKVADQDQRKLILTAIKKAGYVKPKASPTKRKLAAQQDGEEGAGEDSGLPAVASSSKDPAQGSSASPTKRRKKNEVQAPTNSLDFYELLDEEVLRTKATHVNRAPVMTAWAMVVAERMGFKREEALSIASLYTEMNATSKGVSLGIFDESKTRDHAGGSTQPFVELMGRNPVLEREEDGQWRGIVKGTPVDPAVPFGYIRRAFAQTTPAVVGAMRLLALTLEPNELNQDGFRLYCDFRPASEGWGKKTEMRMESILALRKVNVGPVTSAGPSETPQENAEGVGSRSEGVP